MDPFMNLTKNDGHNPELQRLRDLHVTYDDAMGGELVLAPVNLADPGKRILDSGTADGIWLRGVRNLAKAEHEYFGSDIEGDLFPDQPDGISYFQHSFKDPWPEHLRGTFNLAHVRGSLSGSSPLKPSEVVKNLTTLLRPGGWVQLLELNAFSPPSNGPAMKDFEQMAREIWTGIGVGDFANEEKSMLEQAGLQNVHEKRFTVELGKNAKPEIRAQGLNGVTSPIVPLSRVARTVSNSFTEEELSSLQGRVRTELENEGGRVEIIVAWGQRV